MKETVVLHAMQIYKRFKFDSNLSTKISEDSHGDQLHFKLRKQENDRRFLSVVVTSNPSKGMVHEYINVGGK